MVYKLLFQPPTPSYTNTPNFFWLFTSLSSKIPAFLINRDAEYTILFSHGNAEDLGMIYDWFREVSRHLDVNVMAYDYDGYGLSDGEPTEEALFADIEAAFNYLTETRMIPPEKIILYGRSLGSGPTCHQAMLQSKLNKPVRGVILQRYARHILKHLQSYHPMLTHCMCVLVFLAPLVSVYQSPPQCIPRCVSFPIQYARRLHVQCRQSSSHQKSHIHYSWPTGRSRPVLARNGALSPRKTTGNVYFHLFVPASFLTGHPVQHSTKLLHFGSMMPGTTILS